MRQQADVNRFVVDFLKYGPVQLDALYSAAFQCDRAPRGMPNAFWGQASKGPGEWGKVRRAARQSLCDLVGRNPVRRMGSIPNHGGTAA
jgi:hypothetical protein